MNYGEENTLRNNSLFTEGFSTLDLMENKLVYTRKQIWIAQCCLAFLRAFLMEWHLPAYEEADWTRLLVFKNKVGNITMTATWMHSASLVRFYPTPAKLGSARPKSYCLAASNGVCAKWSTARFELLLFKNEVKGPLKWKFCFLFFAWICCTYVPCNIQQRHLNDLIVVK